MTGKKRCWNWSDIRIFSCPKILSINVQLIKSEPHLMVKEIDENLEISFDTKFDGEGCVVQKETETRYKVVEITEQHVDDRQLSARQ